MSTVLIQSQTPYPSCYPLERSLDHQVKLCNVSNHTTEHPAAPGNILSEVQR